MYLGLAGVPLHSSFRAQVYTMQVHGCFFFFFFGGGGGYIQFRVLMVQGYAVPGGFRRLYKVLVPCCFAEGFLSSIFLFSSRVYHMDK